MDFFKMVLTADFLLFFLGLFWLDIAEFIRNAIVQCNPKLFGFILALIVYPIIKKYLP